MSNRNSRVDDNQKSIVSTLRRVGCTVHITSDAGDGFTDLVVYTPFLQRIKLLECKDGNKPPSKRKLTPAQEDFHFIWKDKDCHVVESEEQALKVVGL